MNAQIDDNEANASAAVAVAQYDSNLPVGQAITALRNGKVSIVSSIEGDDFDTKLTVVDAITNSESLADNLNKDIELVNFVIQSIEMVNEQTGELEAVPRTILIAKDGKAFHAISKGVFSSLENLVGVMGRPAAWDRPINVYGEKQRARVGSVITLKLGKRK